MNAQRTVNTSAGKADEDSIWDRGPGRVLGGAIKANLCVIRRLKR
jgi:hypothetical protein